MPILPLLLSASLWEASTDVGKTLSCYEESKNTVVCYDAAGNNPLRIYYSPKSSYSDALVLDLVLNSLGTAADLGSTDWATSQGCYEANPLLPRPEKPSRREDRAGGSARRCGLPSTLPRKEAACRCLALGWSRCRPSYPCEQYTLRE